MTTTVLRGNSHRRNRYADDICYKLKIWDPWRLCVLASCVVWCVVGATYDASTGYVTMTADDKAPYPANGSQAFKSFDADGTLTTTWGVISNRWSDGQYTHSGTNYYAGKTLYAQGVTGTPTAFKGDALVVGAVNMRFSGSSSMSMAFCDNTTFKAGACFIWQSVGHVLGGTISLNGSEAWPNRFQHTRRTSGAYEVKFTPALKGSGKATLQYTDSTVGNPIDTTVNLKDASWAEFTGKMSLLHKLPVKSESTAFVFPGTLALSRDAFWEFTQSNGHHTIGTLDLAQDSTMLYGSGSTDITIADKLVLADGARIRTRKIAGCTQTPSTNKFLSLSATAVAAGVPDVKGALRHESSYSTHGLLPRPVIVTNVLAGGAWDLYLTSKPVVSITNNMLKARSPFGWGDCHLDADNPVKFIEDGKAFHSGVDYLARDKNVIVVKRNAQGEDVYGQEYVFPGDSLTLKASNCGLYGDCYFKELTLCGWAKFRPMSGNGSSAQRYTPKTYNLRGALVVMETAYANCGDNATWRFASDLSGDGTFVLRLEPETTAGIGNTRGFVELAGDNSAFTGFFDVQESAAGSFKSRFDDKGFASFVSGPYSNITLIVHGPTSLGGALPELKADAVKLGNNSRLAFAETAEFAAENRGIAFDGTAYFQTLSNEVVATVKNAITWGSQLTKEGEGVLVFGSAPLFDAAVLTPKLVVEAGFIGGATTEALAGIDIEMKPVTGLYVDAAAAGEMATKGLTLTGNVSVPARISLRIANVPEGGKAKVAVLTAPTATATAVRNALVAEHKKGYRVKLSVVSNGDDTSTICAMVVQTGFVVNFR